MKVDDVVAGGGDRVTKEEETLSGEKWARCLRKRIP